MQLTRYLTRGGVTVQREVWLGPYEREHDILARILDSRRGVLFSSSFEFPGRYTRLDMGFVDPPLVLTARGRVFSVEALNARGRILLDAVEGALAVEILKLPELSPPVPQVSMVPGGASIATAFIRMIRAAPVISSTVSPRTLSAINSAPICDGVALPLMMISNAASASLSLNARPAATCASKGRRSSGKTVLVGAADIAFCISACSVIRKSQLSPF